MEVDTPHHGASKAEPIGDSLLGSKCFLIVVPNPLVVPSNLLHHRVGQIFRREPLLLDELLDLHEGHDAVEVGARCWLAWAGKWTQKIATRLVCQRVATTVHGEAEVDLLRVESVEPQWHCVGLDFANVSLAANFLSKRLDISIPGTVQICIVACQPWDFPCVSEIMVLIAR